MNDQTLFSEVHRLSRVGAAVLLFFGLASIAFSVWFVLAVGDVTTLNSAKWGIGLICGLSGLFMVYSAFGCRVESEVRWDGVAVRFVPLQRVARRFAPGEIAGHEAVTVKPIRHYGGWGLRLGPRGWAYLLSGNRGVLIRRFQGRPVFVGSGRAEEFDAAIDRMMQGRTSSW